MRDNFIVNVEWEPLPIHDLADSSLANWVHHVAHILPQVSGTSVNFHLSTSGWQVSAKSGLNRSGRNRFLPVCQSNLSVVENTIQFLNECYSYYGSH